MFSISTVINDIVVLLDIKTNLLSNGKNIFNGNSHFILPLFCYKYWGSCFCFPPLFCYKYWGGCFCFPPLFCYKYWGGCFCFPSLFC